MNEGDGLVNATHNYWGAADGPGGEFNGSGDAVRGNVTVTPFYTDAELEDLASNVSRRVLVKFIPEESWVFTNDSFTVRVVIDTNGKNVFDAQATVEFNTSLLNATDVGQGGFLSSDGTNTTVFASMIDNRNGTIDYAEAQQGPDVGGISGKGIFFTATFTAKDIPVETTTPLELINVNVSDINATPVEFTTVNGGVTIESNKPPSVNATLLTSVNNVGSPTRIAVNTSDPDGQVEVVRLQSPTGTTISEKTCETANCTLEFSATPPTSTWTGSGYMAESLTVVSEDGAGVAATDSVSLEIFIAGDANGDGDVNIFDAVIVGRSWNANRSTSAYSDAADLNNDGMIDIFDAVIIGQNWRETASEATS